MIEPGWTPPASYPLRLICQTNCSRATWHIKMNQWTGRQSVPKHRCASKLPSGCQKTHERINRTRDPSRWTNHPPKRAALSLCAQNWPRAGCLGPLEKEKRWLGVPKANEQWWWRTRTRRQGECRRPKWGTIQCRPSDKQKASSSTLSWRRSASRPKERTQPSTLIKTTPWSTLKSCRKKMTADTSTKMIKAPVAYPNPQLEKWLVIMKISTITACINLITVLATPKRTSLARVEVEITMTNRCSMPLPKISLLSDHQASSFKMPRVRSPTFRLLTSLPASCTTTVKRCRIATPTMSFRILKLSHSRKWWLRIIARKTLKSWDNRTLASASISRIKIAKSAQRIFLANNHRHCNPPRNLHWKRLWDLQVNINFPATILSTRRNSLHSCVRKAWHSNTQQPLLLPLQLRMRAPMRLSTMPSQNRRKRENSRTQTMHAPTRKPSGITE